MQAMSLCYSSRIRACSHLGINHYVMDFVLMYTHLTHNNVCLCKSLDARHLVTHQGCACVAQVGRHELLMVSPYMGMGLHIRFYYSIRCLLILNWMVKGLPIATICDDVCIHVLDSEETPYQWWICIEACTLQSREDPQDMRTR